MDGARSSSSVLGMSVTSEVLFLWDFGDPEESERRFLEAHAKSNEGWRDVFTTQVARTYGLRRDFETARTILGQLEGNLNTLPPVVRAYYWIELGRTYASVTHKETELTEEALQSAREAYQRSIEIADELGYDYLAVDALHMMVTVDRKPEEQLDWNIRAIERVKKSKEPEAKKWAGPLCNNIGYALHLAGRYGEALVYFERSKQHYLNLKDEANARIEDWMTAWTYRVMGRIDDALKLQLWLEEENDRVRTPDAYVYEELETLYQISKDIERSEHYGNLRRKGKSGT